MTENEMKVWEELNKQYGLNLEMPKELKKWNCEEIKNDMLMGESFDSATQKYMN